MSLVHRIQPNQCKIRPQYLLRLQKKTPNNNFTLASLVVHIQSSFYSEKIPEINIYMQ